MTDTERSYISYLLRLWQSESGGKKVWLASLENPRTGERHGFANLDALFDFLRTQTTDTERSYISYLLRLWQSESGGKKVWLASLESPRTGERHGFANLDALFDFLRMQTKEAAQNLVDLKGTEKDPKDPVQ